MINTNETFAPISQEQIYIPKKHPTLEISPNFIVDFPEESTNFWVGIETHSEKGKNSDKACKIKTFLKNNPLVVYEKPVDIWHNESDTWNYPQYWVRTKFYNNYIILQDYAGIKIYDSQLDLVFQIDVPVEDHYKYVLGCDIVDRKLVVWNPELESFKILMKEYNDECFEQREKIIDVIRENNTKKKSKSLISEATKHIKIMYRYSCLSGCIDRVTCSTHDLPDEIFDPVIEPELIKPIKPMKMYIFVNTDLRMGHGKIASQVGHVVGNITEEIITAHHVSKELENFTKYNEWKQSGSAKIVKKATYLQIIELMKLENSRHVIDEGVTQVLPNSLTVLAFFPDNTMGETFGEYKLM